jgi:hypothetical protein
VTRFHIQVRGYTGWIDFGRLYMFEDEARRAYEHATQMYPKDEFRLVRIQTSVLEAVPCSP